jgi:hypothetical protein
MEFDLIQPSVVCTFTRHNSSEELILYVGQLQEDVQRDPAYETAAIQGEIRFLDPFDPRSFNAFLAEAVVRYYLAKASNTRTTFATLLRLLKRGKIDLILDIPGYSTVSPDKRNDFEIRLSQAPLVNTWRIVQEQNLPSEDTR